MSCRLLGVSRSGYYEWKDRPISARDQENELLLKHIKQIHAESRGSYGSPRVHAELTLGLGLVVNEKRVARLMRTAGVRGLYVRRRRGCTIRNPDAEPAGDLQQLAWEFVRDYYTNPESGQHSMEECRAFISEQVCDSFWTLLDQPGNIQGCSTHFANADADGNPFRWPDPQLMPWPAP